MTGTPNCAEISQPTHELAFNKAPIEHLDRTIGLDITGLFLANLFHGTKGISLITDPLVEQDPKTGLPYYDNSMISPMWRVGMYADELNLIPAHIAQRWNLSGIVGEDLVQKASFLEYAYRCFMGELAMRAKEMQLMAGKINADQFAATPFPQRLFFDLLVYPPEVISQELFEGYLNTDGPLPIVIYPYPEMAVEHNTNNLRGYAVYEPSPEQKFPILSIGELEEFVKRTGVPIVLDYNHFSAPLSRRTRSAPGGPVYGVDDLDVAALERVLPLVAAFHFNPDKSDQNLIEKTLRGDDTKLAEIIVFLRSNGYNGPVVVQGGLSPIGQVISPKKVTDLAIEISRYLRSELYGV